MLHSHREFEEKISKYIMKNIKNLVLLLALFFYGCIAYPANESIEQTSITSTVSPISSALPNPAQNAIELTPTLSPYSVSFLATQKALKNEFSSYCSNPNLASIQTSANGQWMTLHCYNNNGQSIKIVSTNESKTWELSYHDVYGSTHNSPACCLRISHWSQDGNYVYVIAYPEMDGPGFAFVDATALYRLDLNSGELTEALPSGGGDGLTKYYSLAFSPNNRRIAYFDLSAKPFSLILHDLQTGEDLVIGLDSRYNTGGNFIWSSNSQKLVFSVAEYDLADKYIISILLWDNKQKKLITLINNSDIFLVPVEWVGESKVILESSFVLNTSRYEFDLNSKTLTLLIP